MTLTRMPRGQASGLARLIDRDAPATTLSPAAAQALARLPASYPAGTGRPISVLATRADTRTSPLGSFLP